MEGAGGGWANVTGFLSAAGEPVFGMTEWPGEL